MPTRMALEKLKNDLVVMGEMCENALDTSLMGLLDRDSDLACYVMDYDAEIDEMELSIDNQCVELMEQGKLKGDVLRFVAASAKITSDLERVGDLAVIISEHVMFLIREKSVLPQVIDFMEMADQVAQMMRESIQSLLEKDLDLAWKIIDENRIVDDDMQVIFHELLSIMKEDPRTIERCCHILAIAQSLKRVAEQATNVAEEVIFMADGVKVRHHLREFHPVLHMPLDAGEAGEVNKFETALLEKRRPRSEIKKAHAESKRKSKGLSSSEIEDKARTGASKAKDARMKLIKLRSGK